MRESRGFRQERSIVERNLRYVCMMPKRKQSERGQSMPSPLPLDDFEEKTEAYNRGAFRRVSLFTKQGKLYGRSREIEEMLQVYRRLRDGGLSKTEVILLRGPTGVGKTALATSIRSAVLEDGGYFLKGKFDQLQRPEPYAPFVAAFTEFARCVLERGDVLRVREAVEAGVAAEEKVLTDVIPELEKILGPQDEGSTSKAAPNSKSVNRFKYLFRIFLRAVSSLAPLVLFLDDLHWADEASLDLLQSLLDDSTETLFIGTYRSDADLERLSHMLAQLRESECSMTDISVKNLEEDAVCAMAHDFFQLDQKNSKSLATLVFTKTHGNIFFTLEFFQAIIDADIFESDGEGQFDVEEVRIEFGSVNDLIITKIRELPEETQEVLKFASFLGSNLDVEILQRLTMEPISSCLQTAEERGLIVYQSLSRHWQFAHDGIQELIWGQIPANERRAFRYRLGRKLWRSFDMDELDRFIFVVVGQFMVASDLMTEEKERVAVAKLYLRAGERAVQLSSFQTSFIYLKQGISLLGLRSWRDEYSLCLNLYNSAAEVACCTGQFDTVYELVDEVARNSRSVDDTLPSLTTKIHALGSSGRLREAVHLGLELLKHLGEAFPSKAAPVHAKREFQRIEKRLKGKTDEDILRLPLMKDSNSLSAMQILNVIFLYVFMTDKHLAPLVGFRVMTLTLDHGLCTVSCLGFAIVAMYLCGVGNDIDKGYRLGLLAFAIYDKFHVKSWLARLSAAFYSSVHGWKKPFIESLEPLKYAHRVALETGDVEFGLFTGSVDLWLRLRISPLPELDKEIRALSERMIFFRQEMNVLALKPFGQLVHNFMGLARGDITVLTGDILDESHLDEIRKVNENVYVWAVFHRMMLSYVFGDYEKAFNCIDGCSTVMKQPFGVLDATLVVFYAALSEVAHACVAKKRRAPRADKWLKRFQYWARHSPLNFLGQQFLLEAELSALAGDHASVLSKYTCAIALSREAGFIMQTALANECACKYLLEKGDEKTAQPFFREALDLYGEWGSQPKVDQLLSDFGPHFDVQL